MIDAGQERNKGVNRVSALEANDEIVAEAHAQKGLFANMGEIFPAFSDIFSNDGRKEVGFLAIVAWHHSIAKLAARNQISIPPVLLSTISTLLGLSLIRKIKGRESTDRIVEYFDPSVEFLGTWMTLWLVPSLVLLPNALQKIKTPNRSMWLKLIITHFVLWCGSTVGSAKLYELIEGNTERKSSRDNDGNSGVIINASNGNNTASESVTSDATGIPSDVASFPSTISNCDGESSNCLESEADLVQVPSLLDTGSASYNAVENNRSRAMADATASPDTSANVKKTEAGIKEEQFKKQLKLLRFWGAITACFYAAPLQGLMATTAPAIGGTTITAIIAGKMMPENVKKILHPLLFATFISAIAAVLSDRFIGGADKKLLSRKSGSWVESLYTYTSPGPSIAPPCSTSFPMASIPCPPSSSSITDMRIGDIFALILGPACTALAFRIFSNSEKLHSKLPAILTASAVAAVTSLFVSPLLGSVVGIPSELNNALAHRSISSALAVPSARLTGASSELTVAAVLLTGLYGASGQWILDKYNVQDEVAAGVAFGTAAHSIGTASLLPARPEAAATASVSLVAAGIAHAIVCSIPGVPRLINRLACKRGFL